ncbi:putative efflux protein, MATE family [Singulisphaera sp. GP187]|uniref:MATE family efflux transporter n=1 Tax=Singulisphaera sp. GP187 TaxID=1882752 RepID=UPI000928448A|nr:MATE family efflux transporter [Singulisphaera sp. GP187]SIO59644.1 putative efflux protein, MATE family [Singulisphaera sp. GP187]
MDDAPSLAVPGSSIARQVIWLAAPVLVEQSLLYLVGLSDTLLTGRYLSQEHLAAVTVSSYLFWFLGNILTIVSVGGTALVARMIGQGQRTAAARICQQSITIALVVGTATFAIGWMTAPAIVRALNLRGAAAIHATLFLKIVLTITPLLACTTVGIACLRGAGDTRTGMWVMILVNLINVALSWSLLQGIGPFPTLGFAGIALGTAIGEGVGGLVVLGLLIRGRSGMTLDWRGMIPVWHETRRILRISVPAAGESMTNVLSQLWFLSLINLLGATATAAHGVAIRCEAIAFLTITAFAVAASTLTGQYLGAGRPDLASQAARTSWWLGVVVLSGLGVLIYGLAGPMFFVFTGGRQPEVAALGVPVLRVVAFAMPALATINVLNGALRGAGDTRWPWVIVVLGYLVVRIPLTYLLTTPEASGGLGWGLYGAWIAMLADLCLRAALVAARFLHGGWRLARV